ncbi:hypothetical protein PG997_009133 [Apiospora hydei]|uniref:protein-ribulosamine 3-kinase n=1 Tax=Apiospora hydei TaxID=1337664 RepID=A0ABR1VT91_9PEZI
MENMNTVEVDIPVEAIQAVDPAVVEKLPPGSQIESISAHGASFWTRTARIDATLNGAKQSYFLKTCFGNRGRKMVASEYHCMNKIYAVMPDLVPKTIAWGSYSGIPEVHFFLAEFRPMKDGIPDIERFPAKMAELHQYFTRTTKALLELELETRGESKEIRELMVPFFSKVIPRLLRPMETGGRSIRPALIHGDLWHGNASTDGETGLPIIFDAASFYAHNEYELGVWRQPWNEIKEPYRMRYHEHFPKSQPEADYDDRNLLYSIRVNILDSILYKDDPSYRDMLIGGMKDLVEKFPGGLEEWERAQMASMQ